MYPLQLMAQPGSWRVFTSRKHDPAFKGFVTRVLERDQYTCQYCGFQAQDYQEIVNVDQNYYNNKFSNLAVACCFCAQCFFLDAVGQTDFGGGTLIYLPEVEQANLNVFCHVLFCAISNNTPYKASAQSIYRTLRFRSQAVERAFGEGLSDPALMGQLLVESALSQEEAGKALSELRLLPARNRFREQIQHWAKAAMAESSVEEV